MNWICPHLLSARRWFGTTGNDQTHILSGVDMSSLDSAPVEHSDGGVERGQDVPMHAPRIVVPALDGANRLPFKGAVSVDD
jgi:hypothetical protein